MKLRKLKLRNFKRFSDYELDLCGPNGEPRDLTVLVGENGCGKSTLLQAIALPLGLGTGSIKTAEDFRWPGFMLERLHSPPGRRTRIELEVGFGTDEIQATREVAQTLAALGGFDFPYQPPGESPVVNIHYEPGRALAHSPEALWQCRGRSYAHKLFSARAAAHEDFDRLGTILWYHEGRPATTLWGGCRQPLDMAALREEMGKWRSFHQDIEHGLRQLEQGMRDFYDDLATAFSRIFPGRRFVGLEPTPAAPSPGVDQGFWFMLHDGARYYELEEMSSGERAVFPILLDFVRWRINRSVILLDDVELHLHPPLQQFLIDTLPKLGTDNQFIVTTHSQEVVNVVPEEVLHRVEGATVDGDARREAALL